jgi:uncharacterized protein YrrD
MKLLSTSALAIAMTAAPVLAQMDMDRADMIRTRDITGGEIYSMAEAETWNDDTMYDSVGNDWNDIGEIEDVVLDQQGQMIGVVAEVGGFLDIADKHVFLEVNNVRLVPVDNVSYAIVTDMTEEQLEQLPEMDEGFWD